MQQFYAVSDCERLIRARYGQCPPARELSQLIYAHSLLRDTAIIAGRRVLSEADVETLIYALQRIGKVPRKPLDATNESGVSNER